MQFPKEELRQRLLDAAAEEFYRNSYEKASLRRIAQTAGTTIGNVYHYFPNKEELFSAVAAPAYEGFAHFLREHDRHPLHLLMTRHDAAFTRAFVILLDRSEGTRYAGVKEEFISTLAAHALDHFAAEAHHPDFPRILSASFVEGLLSILKTSATPEDAKQLLTDYILFYARSAPKK